MLAFALASLLASPPAGATWTVTLRPAVVVTEEPPAPALEIPEDTEETPAPVATSPRLAPAKSLPKPKTRKGGAASQAKRQRR
jgi:hypothetical protein